jgi:hypothetical protein
MFETPILNTGLAPALKDRPSQSKREYWLDYTPRQKGVDVSDLRRAAESALRQTPAAFYVGEVRDLKDWTTLLDFSGTGHLIFTTAHAGSLVEAMGKIFAATRAKNPARRAIVADRLMALVHLRQDVILCPATLAGQTGKASVRRRDDSMSSSAEGSDRLFSKVIVVPAVWRRTVSGAKGLMAEGQSSMIPQAARTGEAQSCFSRTWFAGQLWKEAGGKLKEEADEATEHFIHDRLFKKCREWDLEGL